MQDSPLNELPLCQPKNWGEISSWTFSLPGCSRLYCLHLRSTKDVWMLCESRATDAEFSSPGAIFSIPNPGVLSTCPRDSRSKRHKCMYKDEACS